mgnify:CR=1 FL=1
MKPRKTKPLDARTLKYAIRILRAEARDDARLGKTAAHFEYWRGRVDADRWCADILKDKLGTLKKKKRGTP